jgi:hypothetical protein
VNGIKHRYHLWKDCLGKDNEHIAKWNAEKKVCEKEIQSRKVVVEQGMLDDFLVQTNYWRI